MSKSPFRAEVLGEAPLTRKQNTALMMLLGVLAVFALPIQAGATTWPAASCSQANVQSAVNSTSYGDTVTVPSGSCTWSTSVNITKGITIAGAGVGSTVITSSGGVVLLALSPDASTIANNTGMKVTGFTLDGGTSSLALLSVVGAGDSGAQPFTSLVITANKFQNGSPTTSGNGAISTNGQVRGVISNNTFDKCDVILKIMGADDTTEWSNTAYNQFAYGSADNLYFENNTILYSSTYAGQDPGWFETGQGGRLVVRFNSWNMTNATPDEYWDVHGFQNWNGTANSGQTGTMLVEYYNNTITNGQGYRWVNHRGSWGIFFYNTWTGSSNPDIEVNQYNDSDMSAGGSGCPDMIVPAPSNYNPLVNNTYVFNNTVNGSVSNMVAGSVGNGCGIAENSNYWNGNASFNGTVGVGIGVLASRPSTCTTGVGYWATDQGNWNQSGSGGQGVFYKCISTNTWSPYYTPYTYPYPLAAGGGSVPPASISAVVH